MQLLRKSYQVLSRIRIVFFLLKNDIINRRGRSFNSSHQFLGNWFVQCDVGFQLPGPIFPSLMFAFENRRREQFDFSA